MPKQAPSIVAACLYLLSTCSMWLSFHRSGRPWFLVVLPIGMTCMVAGFLLRFYYSMDDNSTKLSIYLPFYSLLLLSVRRTPSLFVRTDLLLPAHLERA